MNISPNKYTEYTLDKDPSEFNGKTDGQGIINFEKIKYDMY